MASKRSPKPPKNLRKLPAAQRPTDKKSRYKTYQETLQRQLAETSGTRRRKTPKPR